MDHLLNSLTFLSENSFSIFIYKLLLCCFLGGLLGLERERKGQAAGLRTHIILTIGAMLAMSLSFYLQEMYPNMNVSRIPAQVISGIGFLGAGAILRFGVSIRGLTTAAGLWTSAIIGLTIGAGFFVPAAVTTLAVFFTITILDIIEKNMKNIKSTAIVRLTFDKLINDTNFIYKEFEKYHIIINEIDYSCNLENKKYCLDFRLSWFKPLELDKIIAIIKKWEGIQNITIKNEKK
ncbi:MAG: MgtC/SapB family protein [Candidatus Aureabacteria bacterium]|nr:MgtC/SapB family protein [Candidatus Auribacterota bacterium]